MLSHILIYLTYVQARMQVK